MAEKHTIFDPNGPDIQFEGELAVEHRTKTGGRVRIYETATNRYVVEQTRSASRTNKHLHRVTVCDNRDEVKTALSDTHGGKEALEIFGTPHVRSI